MKTSMTLFALLIFLMSAGAKAQSKCQPCLEEARRRHQVQYRSSWKIPNQCQLPQLINNGQRFANNANRCSFYDCAGSAAASQMRCHGDNNYFLAYGKLYCNRFVTKTQPNLSSEGVRWMNQVLVCLQGALKRTCVYGGGCRDCASTKAFAFKSHVACYTGRDSENQGRIKGRLSICDLSITDQYYVFQTPDKSDLIKREALDQAASTGTICAEQYANQAIDYAEELIGFD